MKIGNIRIPCKDLGKSESFYSDKLGLEKSFGSIDEGFIGYALDNMNILIEHEEIGEFESGRYLGFSFYVDDIDERYNELLEKGVEFTGPPAKQSWGGVMTHILDINGNKFSLVQP